MEQEYPLSETLLSLQKLRFEIQQKFRHQEKHWLMSNKPDHMISLTLIKWYSDSNLIDKWTTPALQVGIASLDILLKDHEKYQLFSNEDYDKLKQVVLKEYDTVANELVVPLIKQYHNLKLDIAFVEKKREELELYIQEVFSNMLDKHKVYLPDLNEVVCNTGIHEIIKRDLNELNYSIFGKAHKSTIILGGSILEALLLDQILAHPEKVKKTYIGRKKGLTTVGTWDLNELIDCTSEMNMLNEAIRSSANVIRQYRNHIHPGKVIKDNLIKTEENEAALVVKLLKIVYKQLRLNRHSPVETINGN